MKIGTGWLGWTEQETDDTSLDVIMDAYEAHLDKLCFMTGRPPPKKPSAPAGAPMTPKLILAMFGKKK